MQNSEIFIHKTAEVSDKAIIKSKTKVWNLVQIRENSEIGEECIISKNVYIDAGVKIGNKVKIQNNCSLYVGTNIEDGVFIGPHVVFTNDKYPRAINPDGSLKKASDWKVGEVFVKYGASIGANSVILPDVTIGKFALVGSGSVVTKDVKDYEIVIGNPAKPLGFACKCGKKLKESEACKSCGVSLVNNLIKEP